MNISEVQGPDVLTVFQPLEVWDLQRTERDSLFLRKLYKKVIRSCKTLFLHPLWCLLASQFPLMATPETCNLPISFSIFSQEGNPEAQSRLKIRDPKSLPSQLEKPEHTV